MSAFSRLSRLSFKLPLFIVGCVALSTLAVGAGGYVVARKATLADRSETLTSRVRTDAEGLSSLLKQIQVEVDELSTSPTVSLALSDMSSAWDLMAPDQAPKLREIYVTNNPKPPADRHRFDGDGDMSMYGIYHFKVHGYFEKMRATKAYPDLYLISEAGDVIYSNDKGEDFTANVLTGPLKDSGLGKAFKAALDGAEQGTVAFSDYAPYKPAGGQAAFLAKSVMNKSGTLLGIVAVQVPTSRLNAPFMRPIGETGRVFVVGDDGQLRTSPPAGARELARTWAPAEGATARTVADRDGLDGAPSKSVYASVNAFGNSWRVVAEQSLAEIEAPLQEMLKTMAAIGAVVFAVLGVVGLLGARSLVRPIVRMRNAVAALLRGETVAIEAMSRKDELGDLARSLDQIHAVGVEAARIRSALDGCPANVMVVDEENVIRYANKAVLKLFRDHVRDFQAARPGFDPEKVVGSSMDEFHAPGGHQGAMTQALSGVHTARVKVGGLSIDLSVSPVYGASGARLGTMLEWSDRTAQLAAQAEVAAVAQAAAAGDFSGRVPLEGKADFLRDMAVAMNEIGSSVDQATSEFADVMTSVARGDLTRMVDTDYRGRFGELKDALNETIERLSETVGTIKATAEDVGLAAREINSGANDLSQRTEQQASSLEETAATTEELAASVKASAQSSRQAVELSEQAMGVASEGGTIVRDAIEAMARIEQASQKISDITGVIDEIAFQTNLLALNAAVEAARAGEAGKGFAVVASEVRTLAQRSSEAAKDITGLIGASGQEVAQGVRLVQAAGQALEKIVAASRKVSSTVSEISDASGEQANGIDEMSQAVAHMDEMTQQNAALAEESAASAASLSSQIERLNDLVTTFRTRGETARVAVAPAAAMAAPLQRTGTDGFSIPAAAPAARPSRPAPARAKRPLPPVTRKAAPAGASNEPDRLRKLAAEAFSKPAKAEAKPTPAPRKPAATTSTGGWEEF